MKTAGSRGTNDRGGLEGGWASGSSSVAPGQPVLGQGQGHQQQLTRQGQSSPAWSSGALRAAAWVSTTQPPSSRPSLFWTTAPLTPNWDVETNPGSQILAAQDLQNPKLLRDKRMLGSGDEAQCLLPGSPCFSAERTPLLIWLSVILTQKLVQNIHNWAPSQEFDN